jgi:uncharacterized protein (DUF934 family)
MALYRNGNLVDADDWAFPESGEAVPDGRPVALRRDAWLAARDTLSRRGAPVGLALEPGEALDPVLPDLQRFALIALRLPRFTDGRAYSTARALRDTYGYRGELRVRGDVLQDQIKLLLRAGFDALEILHTPTIAALRAGRVVAVGRHYQPGAPGTGDLGGEAFSWRRTSPPLPPAGGSGGASG